MSTEADRGAFTSPADIVTTVSTSLDDLPEQHSAKAARLLAAASDLLVARGVKGFTVADVAQRAHVGKGTVYLYWPTKEDLLVGLIGRNFMSIMDGLIQQITDEPDLVRPSRFCPMMLQTVTTNPLISAMQDHNEDLLGVLANHPRSVSLHSTLGPSAMLHGVLPIWRRHGLAREDWEVTDQAIALHLLITGAVLSQLRPVPDWVDVDPLRVLGPAVTALLGPERANRKQVQTTATEIIEFLHEGQAAALHILNA